MKLLKALWASVLAARADTLASAKNDSYVEALRVLERAYKVLELPVPAKNAPIDWNILASQIAIGARDGVLALACCNEALKQVRSGKSGYVAEDRKYVESFCLALQEYCLVWQDGESARREDTALDIDFRKVRKYLKWRFRLPADGTFLSPAEDARGSTLH